MGHLRFMGSYRLYVQDALPWPNVPKTPPYLGLVVTRTPERRLVFEEKRSSPNKDQGS